MGRVLVVDDEEGVRSFLAEALALSGHEVEQAADGLEASRRLARRGFQVVLTDLKMPRMDGMALLRHIRAEQPEVEVVVMTAHGSVSAAVEAMKLGAFDFLQKPLSSPGELRHLIGRALERRALKDAQEVAARGDEPPLSYGAPAMAAVDRALRRVARTDATVLLVGESGTGKEIAARALHRWSPRAAGPFVAINCAALSESLLESELFGHEKGAFTGAAARRRGQIELAEGGTFFLDEVGELAPALQAKLLRVLQEKRFQRVGGERRLTADVRLIAATNRDLGAMMAEGTFRADLYHRLAVFPVRMPALRERREDLPALVDELLSRVSADLGRPDLSLSPGALAWLERADWPGNIRQLRNALERAAILAEGDALQAADFAPVGAVGVPVSARGGIAGAGASASGAPVTMAEAEEQAIRAALAHHGGNRRQAADHLGIGLRTLYDKIKRYDL